MSRRLCPAGADDHGRPVFTDHDDPTTVCTVHGAPESGKPIPPGLKLATVKPDEDGHHMLIEEIDLAGGSGPAQVATDAYRENWDRTFRSTRTRQAN